MSKYLWVDEDFFKWTNEQRRKMRERGITVSTSSMTNLLHNKVIVPNNIDMEKVLQPLIVKKWGKNRLQ